MDLKRGLADLWKDVRDVRCRNTYDMAQEVVASHWQVLHRVKRHKFIILFTRPGLTWYDMVNTCWHHGPTWFHHAETSTEVYRNWKTFCSSCWTRVWTSAWRALEDEPYAGLRISKSISLAQDRPVQISRVTYHEIFLTGMPQKVADQPANQPLQSLLESCCSNGSWTKGSFHIIPTFLLIKSYQIFSNLRKPQFRQIPLPDACQLNVPEHLGEGHSASQRRRWNEFGKPVTK